MKKFIPIAFLISVCSTLFAQNVGIGNNNPQYKLDVSGDVNLTGRLRLNGTATAGKVLKTDGSGNPFWGDDNNTTYSAGTGLSLTGTTFSLPNSVAANTYRSVTVNAQGIVTAGTNPTTLSGYGITDAVPSGRTITINGTANRVTVTGGTQDLSGNRTWTLSAPQDIHTDAIPTFGSGIYYTANNTPTSISPFIRMSNVTTGNTANDGLILGVNGSGESVIANKENTKLIFATNDIARLELTNAGHLIPTATNSFDLGSSTMRFRDIYTTGEIAANGSKGTYGSVSISGSKGTYSGIHFPSTTTGSTLMIRNSDGLSGVWKQSTASWSWYFTGDGVLTVGTVPASNISGTLSVANGGTGATTFTSGNILTGNGTGAIQSTLAYSAVAGNNTIVQRNASGYVYANYFNTTANVTIAAASHFAVQQGSDNFIRWQTPANARTSLGLGTMATQNANAVAITGGTISGASVRVNYQLVIDNTTLTSSNCYVHLGGGTNYTVTFPDPAVSGAGAMLIFRTQYGAGTKTLASNSGSQIRWLGNPTPGASFNLPTPGHFGLTFISDGSVWNLISYQ